MDALEGIEPSLLVYEASVKTSIYNRAKNGNGGSNRTSVNKDMNLIRENQHPPRSKIVYGAKEQRIGFNFYVYFHSPGLLSKIFSIWKPFENHYWRILTDGCAVSDSFADYFLDSFGIGFKFALESIVKHYYICLISSYRKPAKMEESRYTRNPIPFQGSIRFQGGSGAPVRFTFPKW